MSRSADRLPVPPSPAFKLLEDRAEAPASPLTGCGVRSRVPHRCPLARKIGSRFTTTATLLLTCTLQFDAVVARNTQAALFLRGDGGRH